MNLDSKEIDDYLDKIFENNKMNKINNLYLSNSQIEILNKYNIDYLNQVDMKELVFEIEEYINENNGFMELDDLEYLSQQLSEFNYYYNTNK